jgi:PPM family protein phosphatase
VAEQRQAMREVRSARVHDGRRDLEAAAVSDRGGVRAENQDAAVLVELEGAPGCAAVVADGMGGHPDGRLAADVASGAAAEVLRPAPDPAGALADAVDAANRAIGERAVPDERGRSLGTTLVAAVVSGGRASVANVGDSRAYLVRAGVATQLSVDHSWVAEQVRAGHLTPEAVAGHPHRSLLTRALTGDAVEVDVYRTELSPGDVLLLCSDGLWDAVPESRLAELLAADLPLDELASGLCDAAVAAGTADNVSVVLCRVVRAPS